MGPFAGHPVIEGQACAGILGRCTKEWWISGASYVLPGLSVPESSGRGGLGGLPSSGLCGGIVSNPPLWASTVQ